MRREQCTPRQGWEGLVESDGLTFHRKIMPGYRYWDESVCYRFTAGEIDDLERAGNDLHELCLKAAEEIVRREWWSRLHLTPFQVSLIKSSWHSWQQHLLGRFDVLYDGRSPPKLLEYNADTPTSLIESSIVQWNWMEQVRPRDQFNSIHESLVSRWGELGVSSDNRIDFTCVRDFEEDYITTEYLRETARVAGFETGFVPLADLGWNDRDSSFRDAQDRQVRTLFKLYPWEWLLADEFGRHVRHDRVRILEPAWKMLWSNKGLLPILWEIAPNHPNLLPAYDSPSQLGSRPRIRKPILGREGANVSIRADGIEVDTKGEYGLQPSVYQEFRAVEFDGYKPVLGLWMIGDFCRGLGIRESEGWVTNNLSRFVPHYFE